MSADVPAYKREKGEKFISAGKFKNKLLGIKRLDELRVQQKIPEKALNPEGSTSKMQWNDGRRVVELGVLAEGLQACSDCKQPLQLTGVVNEKRYGLGSILNVLCCCGQINTITTGKTHRSAGSRRGVPIYDINTKLAIGKLIYHDFI